jgi:hypothetical protein
LNGDSRNHAEDSGFGHDKLKSAMTPTPMNVRKVLLSNQVILHLH